MLYIYNILSVKNWRKKVTTLATFVLGLIVSLTIIGNWKSIYASETINLSGDKYKFSDDDEYPISQKGYNGSTNGNSFGSLSLAGEYENIEEKNGFKAFDVKQGNLRLTYNFDTYKLNLPDESWNIYDDGCDEIDGYELEEDVNNGTIIVLSSIDGLKWGIDTELTDVFVANSVLNNGSFYETKTVQLINGCYYKVIVAYEMRIKSGSIGIGSFSKNTYDYERYAEVYKFYAVNSEENANSISPELEPRQKIESRKIKTQKDAGYFGNEIIDSKDPHYGWDIGDFVVNGFTAKTGNSDEYVFLKNPGDRVTLWFNLQKDIDCINGNKDITVDNDKDGSDQYFEVPKTNFKRGTLIIRFTDYKGDKTDPIIYTNYLAACTSTGAYTKVELFEEGDYEVALDYSIKDSSGWISSSNDYRIFFRFSIRNSSCTVFPFDISTKSELDDKAVTSNGFSLDLAKTRYLNIIVEHNKITKKGNIYTEGASNSSSAKDGDKYEEEGIYKIKAKNIYSGSELEKTIYVGDSPVLKALSKSGLTLEKINEKIRDGAIIDSDGTISMPEEESEQSSKEIDTDNDYNKINYQKNDLNRNPKKNNNQVGLASKDEPEEKSSSNIGLIVFVVVLICGIAAGCFIFFKKIKPKGDGTVNIIAPKQVVDKVMETENIITDESSKNVVSNDNTTDHE